jgi:hypothetical protein
MRVRLTLYKYTLAPPARRHLRAVVVSDTDHNGHTNRVFLVVLSTVMAGSAVLTLPRARDFPNAHSLNAGFLGFAFTAFGHNTDPLRADHREGALIVSPAAWYHAHVFDALLSRGKAGHFALLHTGTEAPMDLLAGFLRIADFWILFLRAVAKFGTLFAHTNFPADAVEICEAKIRRVGVIFTAGYPGCAQLSAHPRVLALRIFLTIVAGFPRANHGRWTVFVDLTTRGRFTFSISQHLFSCTSPTVAVGAHRGGYATVGVARALHHFAPVLIAEFCWLAVIIRDAFFIVAKSVFADIFRGAIPARCAATCDAPLIGAGLIFRAIFTCSACRRRLDAHFEFTVLIYFAFYLATLRNANIFFTVGANVAFVFAFDGWNTHGNTLKRNTFTPLGAFLRITFRLVDTYFIEAKLVGPAVFVCFTANFLDANAQLASFSW